MPRKVTGSFNRGDDTYDFESDSYKGLVNKAAEALRMMPDDLSQDVEIVYLRMFMDGEAEDFSNRYLIKVMDVVVSAMTNGVEPKVYRAAKEQPDA